MVIQHVFQWEWNYSFLCIFYGFKIGKSSKSCVIEMVNHEHILMKQFRFDDIFNDVKSTPISFNSSITCHGHKIITIKSIYKIVLS
jgi:hypothetical protein